MIAPTAIPIVSTAATVNAFARWAAARVLAPAAPPCPIPIDEPGRYEPSVPDAWEEAGYHLGLDRILADVNGVFPDASARDHLAGAFHYGEGQHAGFSRFARRAGHEAGLDGRGERLPASIPARFAAAFELGHSAGIAERRERGESLADYHQQLADEAEQAERDRDLEQLAREAGGWDRVAGRALI